VLRARVVGMDSDPDPPSRFLCDAFHQVPLRDDPAYVETVAGIAASESARVIYPLPTSDQELFARAREDLAGRGVAVPVSPEDAVRVCNDKWLFYERLRKSRPELVPETTRVRSAEELEQTARRMGYPEGRVCIRRRFSRGAIGLRLLDSGPARLNALLHENPGSLLTSLDEVLDSLDQAETFPEYLVQEYLPPDEWDADVLCRDGDAVIIATRRNLAMTGAGALRAVLEPSEELTEISREVVAELRLNAIVNLAFRYDEAKQPKLLEINPRIPFSILCALGGGVNLVGLAVRQALGERVDPVKPEPGGRFLRHFQSVVIDSAERPVVE
jgi:carbamoyl-phosphate synthase large subunit